MKFFLSLLTLSILAAGCVKDGSTTDPETDAFRQALVSSDDLKMEYAPSNGQALNGSERSLLGILTADAVISTHFILGAHFVVMRAIAAQQPTEVDDNRRVWEHTDADGVLGRLTIERSNAPKGTRFEYKWEAGLPGEQVRTLLDGDVVRVDRTLAGRAGHGVVRFNLTHMNHIDPANNQSTGSIRATFRNVGGVHQVRVKLIDIEDKNDPNFPKYADYAYVLSPKSGGALRWFSVGDVKKDGAPFEKFAATSIWRGDASGIGTAAVFGGSLEVDYWHLGQCWDSKLFLGFSTLNTPDFETEDGDASSCFNLPADLDTPAYEEELEDTDPEVPGAHEDEVE